ncbi:MAG: hypothetical protein LBR27_04755, partial [Bifidobacteriaceae bacterium]|nr:hypothetical protein [Bifidobacteriaceae bacterium]
MAHSSHLHRFAITALTAALVATLGVAAQPAAPADAALVPMSIDTTNQTAVANAYINTLVPTMTVPIGWTGNASACLLHPYQQPAAAAGAPSAAAQAATFTAINYFREMAGLQPVTENTTASQYAQQLAIMVHANGITGSSFVDTIPCYSSYANSIAGVYTQSYGTAGAAGVISLMNADYMGTNMIGRRWLLHEPLSQVGAGSTSNALAVNVAGTGTAQSNPVVAGAGIAWPSAGYFPYEIYPTSQRWSYSRMQGDFTTASVTVKKGSTTYATSIINATASHLAHDPYRGLVWTVAGITRPALGTVDTYTVTISGIDNSGGYPMVVTYQVKLFNAAEATVASAGITGTAAVGNTLTANVGARTPSDATLSYVWYRDGTTQVGTASTYQVQVADAGHQLSVKVTPSKTGWTSFPTTSAAVTVPGLTTITGTVTHRQGASLAGWQLKYNNVTCDDSHTDTPGVTDIYGTITLTAAGTFSFSVLPGECASVGLSNASAVAVRSTLGATDAISHYTATGANNIALTVGAGTVTIASVSVSGAGQVGQTLTANVGGISPVWATSVTAWYRDDGSAAVAYGDTYVTGLDDIGHTFTAKVTASYLDWTSATAQATSAAVWQATLVNVTPPAITGTPTAGSTLTASSGTWSATPVSYTYQWLRNGVAITGESGPTYVVRPADAGKTVTVQVTADKTFYISGNATSAGVAIAALPTVSGTLIHRQGTSMDGWAITYTNVTCDSTHTSFSGPYSVLGLVVLGASGTFNIPIPAGQCARLLVSDTTAATVTVTYGLSDSSPQFVPAGTSGAKLYVGTGPVTIASLTISGTAKVGQTLTASIGAVNPAEATRSVAWYRGSTLVGSGTTYVVKAADVGSSLTAKVTASAYGWVSATRQASSAMVPAVATSTPTPTKTTTPTPSKSTTPTPAGPTST